MTKMKVAFTLEIEEAEFKTLEAAAKAAQIIVQSNGTAIFGDQVKVSVLEEGVVEHFSGKELRHKFDDLTEQVRVKH